jgi:hypothetical protein
MRFNLYSLETGRKLTPERGAQKEAHSLKEILEANMRLKEAGVPSAYIPAEVAPADAKAIIAALFPEFYQEQDIKPFSFAEVKGRFLAYLDAHEWNYDVRCYTREEWEARGERVNNESPFVVTIDGCPLYEVLNMYAGAKLFDQTSDELNAIFGEYGYHYELGHSWSFALYK